MTAGDPDQAPGAEIELRGLSIYTHHGVTAAEREVGQRLEIDLVISVASCDAVLTDKLEDTVDYSAVLDVVVLAATERSILTLERVAGLIGERVLASFRCESVRVRVSKPEPPVPVAISDVSVEVFLSREFGDADVDDDDDA